MHHVSHLSSLRIRVPAHLIVALAMAFGLLIAVETIASYRQARDLVDVASRDQTQLIAQQLRAGIAAGDEALLEEVFFQIVYDQDGDSHGSPQIGMIRVVDADGRKLKSFETFPGPGLDPVHLREAAQAAIATGASQADDHGAILVLATPVRSYRGGETIGAVAIAWDQTGMMASLRSKALWLAAGAAGLAIVVVGLLTAMLRRDVLLPVYRLAVQMHRMRRKTAIERLPRDVTARHDEIGGLARAFDEVLGDLAAAEVELRARSEAEIAKRNQRLDAALGNMIQGLCLIDAAGRLIVANARFQELFGLPDAAVQHGTPVAELFHAAQAAGNYTGLAYDAFLKRLTNGGEAGLDVFVETIREGVTLEVRLKALPEGGWIVTYEDVTERHAAAAEIERLASFDTLTGIPNRVTFRRELARAVADIDRGRNFAVHCLDLDHFKAVNDTLGHPIGDALLRAVADRLQLCLRKGDVVARLGGDEFAVLQRDMSSDNTPALVAARVIEAIAEPFEIDGHQIVIGTSVGIALAPQDSIDPDMLVKASDMALYRAKIDGRGAYRFFEPEMDARMQARRRLEIDLRQALGKEEFTLNYQPIVDSGSERIVAFEALLRWDHPERGRVAPDAFIPLAEEIGIIDRIGAWVLKQACLDAVGWPADIRVAVNLSSKQFLDDALLFDVDAALESSGLDPRRLELEITETVLLQDTERTLHILDRLRTRGAYISMDDFGTGYCSLSYLRKFPIDKIKIDKSFIDGLDESRDSTAIVRAVTGLGDDLGLVTTAEGIETAEQVARIRSEGCTQMQGYFFSKPVPIADVQDLIATSHAERTDAA